MGSAPPPLALLIPSAPIHTPGAEMGSHLCPGEYSRSCNATCRSIAQAQPNQGWDNQAMHQSGSRMQRLPLPTRRIGTSRALSQGSPFPEPLPLSVMDCLVACSCHLGGELLAGLLSQCCGLRLRLCITSPQQALERIEAMRPQLLLIDHDGSDATCATAASRLLALRPQARLVLLSSDPRLDSLRHALGDALLAPGSAAPGWLDLCERISALIDASTGEPGPGNGALPQRLPVAITPEALPAAWRFASLAPRERAVLQLLGAGLVSREIARVLGVTLQTVETYRKNLSAKLGVSGTALVRVAVLHACLAPRGLASAGPDPDSRAPFNRVPAEPLAARAARGAALQA